MPCAHGDDSRAPAESLIEVRGQHHPGASTAMLVDQQRVIVLHSSSAVPVADAGAASAAPLLPSHSCPGIRLSSEKGLQILRVFEITRLVYEECDMSKRAIGTSRFSFADYFRMIFILSCASLVCHCTII
jgi:hypothetical protein